MLNFSLGVVNKDKREMYKTFTPSLQLQGTLKDGSSVVNPTITIKADVGVVSGYNYAHIEAFGRKYFITDIVSVSNNLIEIQMHCDVLSTYAEQLSLATGYLKRNESLVNKMISDNQKVLQCNPAISTIPFTAPSSGYTYCLITTGD